MNRFLPAVGVRQQALCAILHGGTVLLPGEQGGNGCRQAGNGSRRRSLRAAGCGRLLRLCFGLRLPLRVGRVLAGAGAALLRLRGGRGVRGLVRLGRARAVGGARSLGRGALAAFGSGAAFRTLPVLRARSFIARGLRHPALQGLREGVGAGVGAETGLGFGARVAGRRVCGLWLRREQVHGGDRVACGGVCGRQCRHVWVPVRLAGIEGSGAQPQARLMPPADRALRRASGARSAGSRFALAFVVVAGIEAPARRVLVRLFLLAP